MACTIKGLEVFVPDCETLSEARYILLQTGNISLRSRPPQQFSHSIDSFFEQNCQPQLLEFLKKDMPAHHQREEFAFNIFQIQVLFFAQAGQLESIVFNRSQELKDSEIEKHFAIVRRNDLQVNITRVGLEPVGGKSRQFVWVDAGIANFDLRMTTKEVKEVQRFLIRFK